MDDLLSTLLILSASFSSTSCCFPIWDNFKYRCFLAWAFVFVLLCSFTKKKFGSVFPAFCHAIPPCFDHLLFSHDVTKIQTTKISILLRFYFHGVLEQLKTNFQTNFRFKRFLGFVIEYA